MFGKRSKPQTDKTSGPGAASSHSAKRLHNGQFAESVAVITGAGSGIGRASALALNARGVNLALLDIDEQSAKETAAACTTPGTAAVAYQADVRDLGRLLDLAGQINTDLGPLDIVVNNAGVGLSARFSDMDIEDWNWIRSINLDGVINGCHAFGLPILRSGAGQIINMSSGLGYSMRATEPAYVTTKAAVLAFSRSLRADWRTSGVGVTAVCPGVINTPIIDNTRMLGSRSSDEQRAKISKTFSRGHSPDTVAKAVCSAIERDPAVQTAGWEAKLGWWMNGLVPSRLDTRIARLDVA